VKSKEIRNKIKERFLVLMDGPGLYEVEGGGATRKGLEIVPSVAFAWEEKGKTSQGTQKRLAQGERAAVFDADALSAPLTIRPLRQGDRIRPFGMDDGKKVKEILIDRKVPRDERWGRPVVCDSNGDILWIPGIVRSAHAPVNPKTRRPIILRISPAETRQSRTRIHLC
jgi:tRNA(Ile)-lysidine synthetase-like protein